MKSYLQRNVKIELWKKPRIFSYLYHFKACGDFGFENPLTDPLLLKEWNMKRVDFPICESQKRSAFWTIFYIGLFNTSDIFER